MDVRYNMSTTSLSHSVIREISALKDCKGHENIIELLDVFHTMGSH